MKLIFYSKASGGSDKSDSTLIQSINQTKAATICGHVCGAPTVYKELFDNTKGYLQRKKKLDQDDFPITDKIELFHISPGSPCL